MSPWRVVLFSTLGMMSTGFAVYSLTPPRRAVVDSAGEPELVADELEDAGTDAAAEAPQLALGESPAGPVETPTVPRPRVTTGLKGGTAAVGASAPTQVQAVPQFATPPNVANLAAEPAQTPQQQFATPPPTPGTLVAVAVGGTCEFLVDGKAMANGSTLKLQLAPGVYVVACRRVGGVETRSVEVRSGATGMVMFRL